MQWSGGGRCCVERGDDWLQRGWLETDGQRHLVAGIHRDVSYDRPNGVHDRLPGN